jgi:hypothetical protein
MQAPPKNASVRVPGSGIVATVAIIQVDPPSERPGRPAVVLAFHAVLVLLTLW